MNTTAVNKLETFARIGYGAKGIVYFLVGTLTARFALKMGGDKASNTDVFYYLVDFPGGSFLVGLLAFGLALYGLLRVLQGVKDTQNKGNSAKGYITRIGYAFSGLFYVLLAFACVRIIIGSYQKSEDGENQQLLISKLLELPLGSWLAGAVGLGIIGVGLYQIGKGISGSFMKEVSGLPVGKKVFLERIGRWGYISRGIVFGIIGYLFLKAAWHHNAEVAGGKANAFSYLQTWPYGSWLLAAVAIGFMAYGVFMLVQARYADIKIS